LLLTLTSSLNTNFLNILFISYYVTIFEKEYDKYPSFSSRSQGFARRCLLPVSNFGLVHIEGQLRLPCEKIFSIAEESNGGESSSPSAPFSRSPPLASNFNYTLPIGRMNRGERAAGASKRGLKRREWLDARPTYQDNGFHRSRCSVYTNPWQGVALDFHCIALSLTGVESERAHERTYAYARRRNTAGSMFDRYFCVATSTATTCPAFPPARKRNKSVSSLPISLLPR